MGRKRLTARAALSSLLKPFSKTNQKKLKQSVSATIKGADSPTGTLTTSYVVDAITGEVELAKSGFAKGSVKYAAKDSTTQATISSLSNPLDGLKLSNSTLIGQVGVKSEITKQLKGTLSACYVSGPGAIGVETAISKAGGIGATSFAAQCKVGDVMYSAKTTMKMDAYQIAAVDGVGAGETVGVAIDGKAGGDVKASLAYAKKLGGGHSVKCVVVNPVKKSFDPVVSANFVTSVLPKTTTTVAVQVDKAVRTPSLALFFSSPLVFVRRHFSLFFSQKRTREIPFFCAHFVQGYASQTIAGGNALLGWLPRVSPIVFSSVARRFVCAGLIPPMLERHNKRRTLLLPFSVFKFQYFSEISQRMSLFPFKSNRHHFLLLARRTRS